MDLDQFRYYTAWHQFVNERDYDVPTRPWKLLSVDPSEVEWYHPGIRLNWGLGRVEAGEWDCEENRALVRETTTYRGLEQRFEEGRDWKDTALFRRVAEQFESRESVRGYDSLAAFRDVRCAYLDDLLEAIDSEGYRPNADATHETADADNAFEDAYANHLEPLVAIGRDGEIHWLEGYHRFAIASILRLEEVPVYVLLRHAEWQRIRDRLHATESSNRAPDLERHRDHPDVQDVLP
jgi:hypothetical protein